MSVRNFINFVTIVFWREAWLTPVSRLWSYCEMPGVCMYTYIHMCIQFKTFCVTFKLTQVDKAHTLHYCCLFIQHIPYTTQHTTGTVQEKNPIQVRNDKQGNTEKLNFSQQSVINNMPQLPSFIRSKLSVLNMVNNKVMLFEMTTATCTA